MIRNNNDACVVPGMLIGDELRYIGAVVTDAGIKKNINQDSVCVKIAETPEHGQVAMAIVCDGMGGFQKGELASAEVIRTFSEWFDYSLPMMLNDITWQLLEQEWCSMIAKLNVRLMNYGYKENVRLGTTFSGILCINGRYMIVHVGDSRIYCIGDSMTQLTEDHTLVARKIKMGEIRPEDAESHPQRNVLIQCVGASKNLEPQVVFGQIHENTIFILCSDGFRHVLTRREMIDAFLPDHMKSINDLEQAGHRLVDQVKQRNEKDNITVALLKCC